MSSQQFSRLSKDEVRELPLYQGLGLNCITIVEDEDQADQALSALEKESSLGFDTESKPTFRKGQTSPGPTLIQFATQSQAFLFPTRFDAALNAAKALINNHDISKVGFGLRDDKRELRNKLDIELENSVDLAIILKSLSGEKNLIGARAAVAMVLKQRLGKGAQKSNWGAYPLQKQQIIYAANDAHSAICIYDAIKLLKEI